MSGVQKNTSRLLDTILLNNVLTKGQFGVSAVVAINRDGKADIVLDNGKWYEGPNWVAHTYSSLDSSLGTESSLCVALQTEMHQ